MVITGTPQQNSLVPGADLCVNSLTFNGTTPVTIANDGYRITLDSTASGAASALNIYQNATLNARLALGGANVVTVAGGLTLTLGGATSGGTLKLINQLPVSGAALWLDAADASTLHTSGTTVTRWDNKGSYGNAVAGTATLKSGGINGHQALEFNGTSDYLMSDNAYVNTGGSMTLFMVKKRISASATGNKKRASSMSFIGPSSNTDWNTTANLSLEDSQGNDTYPAVRHDPSHRRQRYFGFIRQQPASDRSNRHRFAHQQQHGFTSHLHHGRRQFEWLLRHHLRHRQHRQHQPGQGRNWHNHPKRHQHLQWHDHGQCRHTPVRQARGALQQHLI
ncbi:MAG: hypothetical protein WCO57_05260 [Verrucomicrobiota bacterium]